MSVEILGFDHVSFWTRNATQAASYFICRAGFSPIAYSGLETGSRKYCSYVVQNGGVIFVFTSTFDAHETNFHNFVQSHGDAVKDVAFRVADCKKAFEHCVIQGAKIIKEPQILQDEYGLVITATIEAPFGGIWHTFVERRQYTGKFLPGFKQLHEDPYIQALPQPNFVRIDHCVCNQGENGVEKVVSWYESVLGFHRFWAADDRVIHTEYTGLSTVVIADANEVIKMPITQPSKGKGKSQVQEFVEYSGGPGIQHVALLSKDIIRDVSAWRKRGLTFIETPTNYYKQTKEKVGSKVKVDWTLLERLGILLDWNEEGYLLQILSNPVQDRPTFFLEAIERHNHEGFGAGNFRNLFEGVEKAQANRGNL
ncbi:4-hydroxyphenylpyruvate dioxygenase [Galdieria sulphuraria]|uniref:4-hydroxyphenylpyruvate dioxygenase n=1 Tax=Galdieria sulphuraria TaxID=130081 RepID=M2W973_GALSU|nr:4-hydroxyphenylpyruvate dioxygenase [Galdieria sulphuraria]EME32411.1 4-hydroxyphenylpyruvate dioxygenase [Galdieria sulphuraria]|eukprot:XP_005708931.1 4-hydroxyphenylpyruvate dioxygenase [Galdieria sulphuraria]